MYAQTQTVCIFLGQCGSFSAGGGTPNDFKNNIPENHSQIWMLHFPSAKVEKGFWIEHPVGIVIGNCIIGKEFTIHQNTTIGVKHRYDDSKGLIPKIGNNVHLCANSCILGDVSICDGVTIGAGAVVNNNIDIPGTYVGVPAKLVKASGGYENTYSFQ